MLVLFSVIIINNNTNKYTYISYISVLNLYFKIDHLIKANQNGR